MASPWSSTGLVTANALASYWSGQITLCGKATSSSPTQTDTTYTIPSVKLASVLQSSSSTKTPSVLSVNDNGIEISLRVNNENKLTYTGKSITGTKTGTLTFDKTHSAQTISLKLYYDFSGAISVKITDSTGPRSESQGGSWSVVSDTYTVTVPAKTSYTVTYNANGGVNPPPNATKWYGETLTLSTSRVNPSRTNYEFWHWNTKSDNTGTSYGIGGSYTANAAATLYAIWNPIISYNANGGTGAPASQTKTYGTDLTLSSGKPTRTGLTFAGWGTSSTATTASYAAGGKYTSNSAATLYAIWKYTVNFNGNGNGVNPASQTAVYGHNVTIAGYPTRSGYRFLGWNSAQDGTGTHYAPGASLAVNENCTLYAQWRKVTVSSVKVTRNVQAIGFTSTWSCSSTVGGTVTVTAQYSLDDGANWHDCTLTGDATKTKVAGTDLSGTVSWASTADEDVAIRVMVTAKFTDTYSSTSISGGHDETAQRGGTIPKEFRLFDALHGGTGLAIGAIATLANTFEVALSTIFNNVSATIKTSNIDRDGTPPLTSQFSNGRFRIADVDNGAIAYYDGYQLTTGETGARLVAFAEDENGDSITNSFRVGKMPDGTNLYYVTDPAAFRRAVNAAGASDQSAQNLLFSPMTGSTQLGAWYWNVTNTAESSLGDRVAAIFSDNRLSMYNSTDASTMWTAYTTQNPQPADAWDVYKSTTVSQVITAASGITVSSVAYASWGKVAQLSVVCSGFSASTGSQTVGTVVSGKRPVYNAYATDVGSANARDGTLSTTGALTVYWATAPSTTGSYTIRFIYILA